MSSITHSKINAVPDWSQADLDAQIAVGNYAPGTDIADIVQPSDWNHDHNFTGDAYGIPFFDSLGNLLEDKLFQFNTAHNTGLNVGSKIWVNDGIAETPDSTASLQMSANTNGIYGTVNNPVLYVTDGIGGWLSLEPDEGHGLPSDAVFWPHEGGTLALTRDITPLSIGEEVIGGSKKELLYVNVDNELDQVPISYDSGSFDMEGSLSIKSTPGSGIPLNIIDPDSGNLMYFGFESVFSGYGIYDKADRELAGYDSGPSTFYYANRNISLSNSGDLMMQSLYASFGDNNFLGNGTTFVIDDSSMSIMFTGVLCNFNAILTGFGGDVQADGDFAFTNIGKTLSVKTGSNAKAGTATLSGGTITINTTAITTNSIIYIGAPRGTLTNLGMYKETARTAGTSFTIGSVNILDSSTFDWWLVEKS